MNLHHQEFSSALTSQRCLQLGLRIRVEGFWVYVITVFTVYTVHSVPGSSIGRSQQVVSRQAGCLRGGRDLQGLRHGDVVDGPADVPGQATGHHVAPRRPIRPESCMGHACGRYASCLAARAAAIFQLSEAPKAVSGTSLNATTVPATVARAPKAKAARSFPVSLKTLLQGACHTADRSGHTLATRRSMLFMSMPVISLVAVCRQFGGVQTSKPQNGSIVLMMKRVGTPAEASCKQFAAESPPHWVKTGIIV